MSLVQQIKTTTPAARLIQSRQWKHFRNWLIRKRERRDQSHYTHFLRLPTQFKALAGPVVQYVRGKDADAAASEPLRVAVVGCSIGAEVYTIASTLKNRLPALDFRIEASDISPDVIEKARQGVYAREQVYSHAQITESFIAETFEARGGSYFVRKPIAERVRFKVADVFSPDLPQVIAPCEIVFAQNFLFHMQPKTAHRAFDSIVRLLKARSALFIDGIDLPVREQATKRNGLVPLDYEIEQIHNENLRLSGWPWHYWGLEPLSKRERDWRRRYATIFLKPSGRP